MGVYIKSMTLDEFSEYGDYCQTLIGTGQAEEIPPHGRLIDSDALMKEFEKAENAFEQHGREFAFSFISSGQEISTEWYAVEVMVEDAPTIIPAEEDE